MKDLFHLYLRRWIDCSNGLSDLSVNIKDIIGETYTVSTGYWSNDIEQAGYCTRCGEDTHGEYYN